MGKTLSVDKTYGDLKIQDVNYTYYSGAQITGRLVIHLHKDFPSNVLHLVLRGKEKVRLPRGVDNHHTPRKTDPTAFTTINKTSKYSEESCEVFNMTFPLYATGPTFPRGHHDLPFVINLPVDMPPSFSHNFFLYGEELFGKVSYKLHAALQTHDKTATIHDERRIEIKKGFNSTNAMALAPQSKDLNISDFNFVVNVDKTYAMINDTINAYMRLDNAKSAYEIKKMKWKTIMRTTLKANGQTKETRTRIDKVFYEGVKPHGLFEKKISIPINIPKSNEFKNSSTYHGNLIKNTFEIEFSAVTSALWLFSKDNSIKFDIVVADKPVGYNGGFIAPNGGIQPVNSNMPGPSPHTLMPLNPGINLPTNHVGPNPNMFMPLNPNMAITSNNTPGPSPNTFMPLQPPVYPPHLTNNQGHYQGFNNEHNTGPFNMPQGVNHPNPNMMPLNLPNNMNVNNMGMMPLNNPHTAYDTNNQLPHMMTLNKPQTDSTRNMNNNNGGMFMPLDGLNGQNGGKKQNNDKHSNNEYYPNIGDF